MASSAPPGYVRPAFKTAIRVLGGYVWEHDLDENGAVASDLRPHYAEGQEGYPEGGYPALADLKNAVAKATAEAQAAKRAPLSKRDIEA